MTTGTPNHDLADTQPQVDPQGHKFTAEAKRKPNKRVLITLILFVVVMALVALGSYAGKAAINSFQQERENKKREKELAAKSEQVRSKRTFSAVAPTASASAPVDAPSALPVNFGVAASAPEPAAPIPLKSTPAATPRTNSSQAAAPHSGSGQGTPPPPPATMMLGGEAQYQAVTVSQANPSGNASSPATPVRDERAGARSGVAEYDAKMAALLANAQASAAPPGASASGSPAMAGSATSPSNGGVSGSFVPRTVGRGTVQDYARVNAARTPITGTPQAVAAKLGDRSLLIARGSGMSCILRTQLFTNVPGTASCLVDETVYSDDGTTALVDKGAVLSGTYGNTLKNGDSRIAVVWNRLKTPDGNVIDLDSPATDGVGTMGVDGFVDNHWLQRIGAAFLLSVIDDAVAIQVAKESGGSVSSRPTSVADTTKSMSEKVLDSTINIPPTILRNRGARLRVSVERDLWFYDVYSVVKR